MNIDEPITLEEILDDIMHKESEPNHEALERWTARYPEHREPLARFFATWAVQTELPEDTTIDEAQIRDRLVSHALNLVYRQAAARPATTTANGARRLRDAIAQCGLSEAEFGTKCNLDGSLVAKLDRRLIRAASIPTVLVTRVAEVLHLAFDLVQKMFAGEPIPVHSYKAKRQPVLKTEDFLEAVGASDLSPDAKAEWTQAVAAEVEEKETT